MKVLDKRFHRNLETLVCVFVTLARNSHSSAANLRLCFRVRHTALESIGWITSFQMSLQLGKSWGGTGSKRLWRRMEPKYLRTDRQDRQQRCNSCAIIFSVWGQAVQGPSSDCHPAVLRQPLCGREEVRTFVSSFGLELAPCTVSCKGMTSSQQSKLVKFVELFSIEVPAGTIWSDLIAQKTTWVLTPSWHTFSASKPPPNELRKDSSHFSAEPNSAHRKGQQTKFIYDWQQREANGWELDLTDPDGIWTSQVPA